MSLDPQLKALLDAMAAGPAAPKITDLPPAMAREMYRGMSQMMEPQDLPTGGIEDRTIPGPGGEIPVRIYTPVEAGKGPLPVIVFFHGGGWVIGDLDTHDALCRTLANEAGAKVIAVHYRLAPEHVFPAAVEDCYAATKWVSANAAALGIDASRIAVAGDSAGGNLSAVISQLARDAGEPEIGFQLLIYPAVDAKANTPSYVENGEGYFLEKTTMDWFFNHYSTDADVPDPRLSPLRASSLENLPAAYIVTAGFDPLRDEGKLYADALAKAGVAVEYVNYSGMVHGFFNMQGVLDESRKAVKAAAAAVKKALA
ncbi:MAG: alpha/beta hydrolase [Parvibaculaceae bacterium]|nr:alpha/beta hydrolase [Parvibaculaceae bacterium]